MKNAAYSVSMEKAWMSRASRFSDLLRFSTEDRSRLVLQFRTVRISRTTKLRVLLLTYSMRRKLRNFQDILQLDILVIQPLSEQTLSTLSRLLCEKIYLTQRGILRSPTTAIFQA